MPKQFDFIKRPDLTIKPENGRAEPRLWVRRLKIWSAPSVVIRDMFFRPGLNIVWSPGAENQSPGQPKGTIGHGSGKTLFCRLLRYCLGEDRFAPEGQRERIAMAFEEGLVGAEVVLDGKCWAIVRPIGNRRRHMAVMDGDIDTIAAGEGTHTGIEPLLRAVETSFLPRDIAALIPGQGELRGWLTALAWLTRDQECRLNHVLEWRAAMSGSESPARALDFQQKLDAVRVFLNAITPKEHTLRSDIKRLREEQAIAEREAEHRKWEVAQTRTRLIGALGLIEDEVPQGPLAVELLNNVARKKLAAVAKISSDTLDTQKARENYNEARTKAEEISRRRSEIDAQIPEVAKFVSYIKAELPSLSYEKHEAGNPICPICEVPIDRVLAEGCKLSHKLPDLEGIRQRHERLKKKLTTEEKRLSDLQRGQKIIFTEEQAAKQEVAQLGEQLQKLDKTRDEKQSAWYEAKRLVDDTARFHDLLDKQDKAIITAHSKTKEMEQKRDQAVAHRDDQAEVFQTLTRNFDAILRELVGDDAEGKASLTGSGLELVVQMGGERSTAAIESLKIIAFDLAVLCMSIEGGTQIPPFLIHDSPREADLDLALYHRLFRFAVSLEKYGAQPLFQYFLTTTTEPPDDLANDPWLRLVLHGSPSEERLLKQDL